MSEIPPAVLKGLNDGTEETITLVEWLAIDIRRLIRAVAPGAGFGREAAVLYAAADLLASEGVEKRSRGMGVALHAALDGHPKRREIFESLAASTSDMVRAWAGYIHTADATLSLPARLKAARRFAADPSVAVRECAWSSFRSHLAADLERGLVLLRPWVVDSDPNIRRCAVEATRPRGVWTNHIEALRDHPEMGLPLLEPVRSDESRYVQNAVANWLNDASKTRPEWVRRLTSRWKRESKTAETAYIVKRALRTLEKNDGETPRPERRRARSRPSASR